MATVVFFSFSLGLPGIFHIRKGNWISPPAQIFCPSVCPLRSPSASHSSPRLPDPTPCFLTCSSRRAFFLLAACVLLTRPKKCSCFACGTAFSPADKCGQWHAFLLRTASRRRNGSHSACFDLISNKAQREPF